jgi:hypothetical protein
VPDPTLAALFVPLLVSATRAYSIRIYEYLTAVYIRAGVVSFDDR